MDWCWHSKILAGAAVGPASLHSGMPRRLQPKAIRSPTGARSLTRYGLPVLVRSGAEVTMVAARSLSRRNPMAAARRCRAALWRRVETRDRGIRLLRYGLCLGYQLPCAPPSAVGAGSWKRRATMRRRFAPTRASSASGRTPTRNCSRGSRRRGAPRSASPPKGPHHESRPALNRMRLGDQVGGAPYDTNDDSLAARPLRGRRDGLHTDLDGAESVGRRADAVEP